jgi:starvation-inducible DNA-binding protein
LEKIIGLLNHDLADEYILLTKTKKYHWNVVDPRFNDLHKFLDEQYELLSVAVDDVAERARSLGGKTKATLKEFIESSQIREDPGAYPDGDSMLGNLLKDHETIIKTLRKHIEECQELKDEGTANFLTDKMEEHEKMAWMLRSYLGWTAARRSQRPLSVEANLRNAQVKRGNAARPLAKFIV